LEAGPLQLGVNLGHRTHLDALVHVALEDGSEQAIAWEVKLTDRYVSRRQNALGRRYEELNSRVDLFCDVDVGTSPEALQLLRLISVAAAYSEVAMARFRPPVLLVLHHDLDPHAHRHTRALQRVLTQSGLCGTLSLSSAIQIMKATEPVDQVDDTCQVLWDRYSNLSASEEFWEIIS
jgi:hypothetical protein